MNIIELDSGLLVEFDKKKSAKLANNPKRKCSFYDAMHMLEDPNTIYDNNDEVPPKRLAIGWVKAKLITLIYETRFDIRFGEYEHLVTLWKTTKDERITYGIE